MIKAPIMFQAASEKKKSAFGTKNRILRMTCEGQVAGEG
jgi:hypothetical protein